MKKAGFLAGVLSLVLLFQLNLGCGGIPAKGKGKYTYPNGGIYEGNYNYKLRDGQGKFTWPNGNFYEGTWTKDKIKGQGTYNFKSGNAYTGNWDNGKIKEGTIRFPDGTSYTGDITDWKIEGHGKYQTSGYDWSGKFVKNKRLGKGVLTVKGPDLGKIKILPINVTGEWSEWEAPNATIEFLGGIKFYTAVSDGNIRRQGRFDFPDGAKLDEVYDTTHPLLEMFQGMSLSQPDYRGFLLKGVRTGYGVFVDPEKGVYQGGFYKGKFAGPGQFTGLKGERFEGSYKNGKRHGRGKEVKTDGTMSIGDYSLDKRDGWFSDFASDGKLLVYQKWSKGKPGKKYDLKDSRNISIPNLIVKKGTDWRFPKKSKSFAVSHDDSLLLTSAVFKGNDIKSGKIIPLKDMTDFFQGEIKKGVFNGTEFKKGIAVYAGEHNASTRHGKGVCNHQGSFEPCEYKEGTRIDPIWIAREAARREQERLNRCSNAYASMENAGRVLENALNVTCADEQQSAGNAIQSYSNASLDCSGCYRRTRNSVNAVFDCSSNVKNAVNKSDNIISNSKSALRNDKCGDLSQVNSFASSLGQLKDQVRENANRISSAASSLKSSMQSVSSARSEAKAERDRQQMQAIIGAIQSAGQQIIAARRQQHNIQMQSIRAQQSQQRAWQAKVKARNAKWQQQHYANLQRQQQAMKKNVYSASYKSPTMKVNPFAAAKKSCLARGGKWKGNACQTTTVIPWHGRACYDPTGKHCKTGETYSSKSYASNSSGSRSASGSSGGAGKKSSGFGSGYSSGGYSKGSSSASSNPFGSGSGSTGDSKKSKRKCPENLTNKCISSTSSIKNDVLNVPHYNMVFNNRCGEKMNVNLCYHIHGRSEGSCYGIDVPASGTKSVGYYRKSSGDGRYKYVAWKGITIPLGCGGYKKLYPDIDQF